MLCIDVMYKEVASLKWFIIWFFLIFNALSTLFYVFMLFWNLVDNIWYQSKMILGFGSFKLVVLAFSLLIFWGDVLGYETLKGQLGHIKKD